MDLSKADESQLIAVWRTVFQRSHADVSDITALDALAANRRLVDSLTDRRWIAMYRAREAGASWSAIGAALGMSKQGAADWYRRRAFPSEIDAFEEAERCETNPGPIDDPFPVDLLASKLSWWWSH